MWTLGTGGTRKAEDLLQTPPMRTSQRTDRGPHTDPTSKEARECRGTRLRGLSSPGVLLFAVLSAGAVDGATSSAVEASGSIARRVALARADYESELALLQSDVLRILDERGRLALGREDASLALSCATQRTALAERGVWPSLAELAGTRRRWVAARLKFAGALRTATEEPRDSGSSALQQRLETEVLAFESTSDLANWRDALAIDRASIPVGWVRSSAGWVAEATQPSANAAVAQLSRVEALPFALGKLPRDGYLVELELELVGSQARAVLSVPAPNGQRTDVSVGARGADDEARAALRRPAAAVSPAAPARRVRVRACRDSRILVDCDGQPLFGNERPTTHAAGDDGAGADAAVWLSPADPSTRILVRAARMKPLCALGASDALAGLSGVPASSTRPAAEPPTAAPDAFAIGCEFTGSLQKDSDSFPCSARVTASNPRAVELAVHVGTFVTAWTFERDEQRVRRCAGVQLVARGHRNFQSLRDVVIYAAAFDGQTLRASVRWCEVWRKRKPRYAVSLELRPK